MERLPKEINIEIFKNLPGKEILKLCGTSKKLNSLCSDDSRYLPLWKLKIEEEFQEIYTGKSAFTQYKYLSKLHSQYFYILYYANDDDPENLVGIYDMYGKAVMAGINYIQDQLKDVGRYASAESIKYLFWNNTSFNNSVRYLDYHELRIERVTLDKLETIVDERKFFADREKLYFDLFGKSSEGASSQMKDPFTKRKTIVERIAARQKMSLPVLFFSKLDMVISLINFQSGNIDDLMYRFKEFNLGEKEEILKKYILENIFEPKEKGEDEKDEREEDEEDEREEDEEDEREEDEEDEREEDEEDEREEDEIIF